MIRQGKIGRNILAAVWMRAAPWIFLSMCSPWLESCFLFSLFSPTGISPWGLLNLKMTSYFGYSSGNTPRKKREDILTEYFTRLSYMMSTASSRTVQDLVCLNFSRGKYSRMPQHFFWRLLLSANWFLGEPSANSVPGNKDNSEDLEVAVPQIPRFQEGEISRSQDLCSTSSNIVTVDGAPIYSVIQGASHTQTQLYCEHLSEMPEIDCWVYFGPEDKNIKLNIARIVNAVQVTLWLSITNPQCHVSSFAICQ